MRSVSPNLPQSGLFSSGERGSKVTNSYSSDSLCTPIPLSVSVTKLIVYSCCMLLSSWSLACLVYAAELPKRDDSSPKSIIFIFSWICESNGSFQHGTCCKYLDKSIGNCAETKPPDRQQWQCCKGAACSSWQSRLSAFIPSSIMWKALDTVDSIDN